MTDKIYSDAKIAELYDLCNTWGDDNDFYLSLAIGSEKLKILDLGCGTGILSHAFAEKGYTVVGCDPALAMLEIARKNDKNKKVEWVLSGAQEYKSTTLFDLIIMTGHTFQAFLTDEDVLAVFRVVKKCLSKNGLFVFETRNPHIDWIRRWSDSTKNIQCPSGETVIMSTDSVKQDDNKILFSHHYTFLNESIESKSTLLFLSSTQIKDLLNREGLRVIEEYGNWDSSPISDQSPEIIFKVIHQ